MSARQSATSRPAPPNCPCAVSTDLSSSSAATRGNRNGNCTCAVCADLSSGSSLSPGKDVRGSMANESCRSRSEPKDRSSASAAVDPFSECMSTSNRQSITTGATDPACVCKSISGRTDGASGGRDRTASTSGGRDRTGSTSGGRDRDRTGSASGGRDHSGSGGAGGADDGKVGRSGAGSRRKKGAQVPKPGPKGKRRGGDKDYGEGGTKAAARPRAICVGEGAKERNLFEDECEDEMKDESEEAVSPEEVGGSADPCYQIVKREPQPPAEYFPQTGDGEAPPPTEPMGPLNMWATGRPDWTPLGGLTGTRPIVDRHSIARYSLGEWRQHNLETFQRAAGDSHMAHMVDFNARSCIEQTLAVAPKNQRDVTRRLQQRTADVRRWLVELDKAHQAIWREIQNLMTEEDRLRRFLCALEKIMHIVGECIEIRTTRMDSELVRDEVEIELCKELALANEIRQLMHRTKDQIQQQLDVSRAAKHRLEEDLSDKRLSIKIDTENIQYTVQSPLIMFHSGAARFMNNQSTPESWEITTRENLCLSENERAKICTLRALIETVIVDSARDLTAQRGSVDDTLAKSIELNTALVADLEDQLKRVLKNILDMERLISDLKDALRKFDFPLKKAQTRLHNREHRPRVENTRDCPQYGLVDEIKSVTEQSSALMAQLCQAQDALMALLATRRQLEREVQAKRKNIYIDRDRIQQPLR